MKSAGAQSDSYVFGYAAWLVSMVATLGSLFFGEVMKLPPCTLCWYQRICLFPLTLLIAAGIVLRDKNLIFYALPLVCVGLGLALYHNFIYYGVVSEALSPCTQGIPCNTRQIEWLGFITIPLMALLAFLSIFFCLVMQRSRSGRAHP